MSMISEQVRRLREFAKTLKYADEYNLVNGAADTIEELSAKLHNSQMERSSQYYNGGWIPVSEKLPEPWVEVLTTYEYNGKRFVQSAEYAGQTNERGEPLFCADSDERAPHHYDFQYVAWMSLPTPYKSEIPTEAEGGE